MPTGAVSVLKPGTETTPEIGWNRCKMLAQDQEDYSGHRPGNNLLRPGKVKLYNCLRLKDAVT